MNNTEQQFLKRATEITEANLHNEQFGVSELAREMGMSRTTLHRKIILITKTSVSQFICQVRLTKALELLKQNTTTVSETAYECGFHSVPYFTKCFHDYFGYPPGEAKNHETPEIIETEISEVKPAKNKRWVQIAVVAVVFVVMVVISSEVFFFRPFAKDKTSSENTIAILPFVNDSGVEFAPFTNWMGIEIGNKLGKIENMLVVPQSTTENYRDSKKSNHDIARELMVNHLLRGRTIKTGDKILLNIELLDAKTGNAVFTEMYERDLDETEEASLNRIFEICDEVVFHVSNALQTELTEEEKKLVPQKSTQNPEALQYFLHGNQLILMLNTLSNKSYTSIIRYAREALKTFEKCVNLDSTYSDAYLKLAHIYIAVLYPHTSDLPLASLYLDSGLVMIEKALHFNKNQTTAYAYKRRYFISKGMYDEANKLTPIVDKQVKNAGYYMGRAMDYFDLHDYYHFIETISKYHEIKPITEVKPPFLFDAELLCYTAMGFPELSRKKNAEWFSNINDTLLYERLKIFIEIKAGNYKKALELTEAGLKNYPNSIQYLNYEVIILNFLRDYDNALKALVKIKKEMEKTGKPLYTSYVFGHIFLKNGMVENAKPFFEESIKILEEQIKYTNFDARGYYSHFSLSKIYAALNNKQQSLYYLGFLKNANNTANLIVYDLKNDPMFDNVRQEPEFQKIASELEKKYLEEHEKIKKLLISKGLEPV